MFSEKGDQRLKVRMKPIWILMKLRRRVRPLRPPWSWPTASVVTVIYSGSALHVAVQSLIHVWLRNHGLQHTRLPGPSSPELAQIHIHWVCEAIQLSHPLSSPSPPAPNPSQHQGLFQWFNSSHAVAKVLEFQLQHQSFQWPPRTDLL